MFDRQHIALPRVDATRSGTSYEPPSRYTRPRAAPEARPASPVSERAQAAAVQIDQLERELRPPCAFGKPGDSWKADADTLFEVTEWTRSSAPALLARLRSVLDDLDNQQASHSTSSSTLRNERLPHAVCATVVIAAARFVPARPSRGTSVLCDGGSFIQESSAKGKRKEGFQQEDIPNEQGDMDEELGEVDPWINSESEACALLILSHPLLHKPRSACAEDRSETPRICQHILLHYLKPLFAHTTSSRLDPSTGRARVKSVGLSGPAFGEHVPSWEDAAWKGLVDLDTDPRESTEARSAPSTQRSEALGCCNVLAWCVDALARSGREAWEAAWHLVLPPLLALLDDPDPRYKTMGARIVGARMLDTDSAVDGLSSESEEHDKGVSSDLLLRTGVAALLDASLRSALTFATDPKASTLLDASLGALRALILRTTAPILTSKALEGSAPIRSETGAQRFAALCSLLDEGIFNVWAYASDRPRMTFVTSLWLVRLSSDLGIGAARFLPAILQFLSAQLSHPTTPSPRTLKSATACVQAANAVIRACTSGVPLSARPPGIQMWAGTMGTAVARCWTRLHEHLAQQSIEQGTSEKLRKARQSAKECWDTPAKVKASQDLETACQDLYSTLIRANPDMDTFFARLRALDSALFDPLVASALARATSSGSNSGSQSELPNGST